MKKIIFLFCLGAAQIFAPNQLRAQEAETPAAPSVIPKQQNCPLPTILFDAGRTNIKQSFYPKVFTVARFMIDNPDLIDKMTSTTAVAVGSENLMNILKNYARVQGSAKAKQ